MSHTWALLPERRRKGYRIRKKPRFEEKALIGEKEKWLGTGKGSDDGK